MTGFLFLALKVVSTKVLKYAARGWSRALILVSVELCRVKGQPEVAPWLALTGKIFKIIDKSGQLIPTFLSKNWWKHKKITVLWWFFVLFTVFMCSDSIFNLLKRVADVSFLLLRKMLVCLFLPFLNLVGKIRYPQNRYSDPTSALDQPCCSSD